LLSSASQKVIPLHTPSELEGKVLCDFCSFISRLLESNALTFAYIQTNNTENTEKFENLNQIKQHNIKLYDGNTKHALLLSNGVFLFILCVNFQALSKQTHMTSKYFPPSIRIRIFADNEKYLVPVFGRTAHFKTIFYLQAANQRKHEYV